MGSSSFRKSPLMPAKIAVVNVFLGTFFVILALAMPRWRFDADGTRKLAGFENLDGLEFSGWRSVSYGLSGITKGMVNTGSTSDAKRSWTEYTDDACRYEEESYFDSINPFHKEPINLSCTTDQEKVCDNQTRFLHSIRCVSYKDIKTVSTAVIALSCIMICLCIGGGFIILIGNVPIWGCRVAAVWVMAGLLGVLVNVAWIGVTDNAFKDIRQYQFFPWPSLAMCPFLHFYGCVIIIFMGLSLAKTSSTLRKTYNPEQGKLDRKMRMVQLRAQMGLGGPGGLPSQQPPAQPQVALGLPNQQPVRYMGGMAVPAPAAPPPPGAMMMPTAPMMMASPTPQVVGAPQPMMVQPQPVPVMSSMGMVSPRPVPSLAPQPGMIPSTSANPAMVSMQPPRAF